MSLKDLQDRLLLETAKAAAEHRRVAIELETYGGRSLAVGDLFLFADSEEHAFEWAIIGMVSVCHRHPSEIYEQCWVVVPADDHPLVGSHDVPVESGVVGGLVLRCGVWAQLSSTAFESRRRTGVLPREVIALAQSKWRAHAAGEPERGPLSWEVDSHSEYRQLIEELISARQRLISAD